MCSGKYLLQIIEVLTKALGMRLTPTLKSLNRLLNLKSMKMLDHYAQFNPSPLTIHQFLEFGRTATEEDSFTFLRKELPVRLSNIIKEINLLPSNLLQMPSVLTLQVDISLKLRVFQCVKTLCLGIICNEREYLVNILIIPEQHFHFHSVVTAILQDHPVACPQLQKESE